LLDAIDHPETDNPYLIRARHNRKHRLSALGQPATEGNRPLAAERVPVKPTGEPDTAAPEASSLETIRR
jgi:hypothetical protein